MDPSFKNRSTAGALAGLVAAMVFFPAAVRAVAAALQETAEHESTSFTGRWQRDPARSDDPQQKFQEAMTHAREERGGTEGRRGGFGGRPGGGGRPPAGGRKGAGGRGEGMGSLMAVQETLTTRLEGGEFRIEAAENVSIYYLDGKKHSRQAPDGSQIETDSRIAGLTIIIQEKTERGPDMQRKFELAPEGNLMVVTLSLKSPRARNPVVVKTVYELVEENPTR